MSRFNDIEDRVAHLKSEADKRNQHEKERQERVELELAQCAIIERNVREIAVEAVDILRQREVPTLPIWNHVIAGRSKHKQASSISGSDHTVKDSTTELQQTSEGWYILRQGFITEHRVEPPVANYCLTIHGEVQSFTHTELSNYRKSTHSDAENIEGIINTSDVALEVLDRILNKTDAFKNGVASLIAGLGPYENIR